MVKKQPKKCPNGSGITRSPGLVFLDRTFFFYDTCRGGVIKEDIVKNGYLLFRHFLYFSLDVAMYLTVAEY